MTARGPVEAAPLRWMTGETPDWLQREAVDAEYHFVEPEPQPVAAIETLAEPSATLTQDSPAQRTKLSTGSGGPGRRAAIWFAIVFVAAVLLVTFDLTVGGR